MAHTAETIGAAWRGAGEQQERARVLLMLSAKMSEVEPLGAEWKVLMDVMSAVEKGTA